MSMLGILVLVIIVIIALAVFINLMDSGDEKRRRKFLKENFDLCDIRVIEPNKEYLVMIKPDTPSWLIDREILKQGLAWLFKNRDYKLYYLQEIWSANGAENPDELLIRKGYRVIVLDKVNVLN